MALFFRAYSKKKMKAKPILFITMAALLQCCAPSTYITGSWKNSSATTKQYKSILVAALTGNTIAKSTLENDMQNALGKNVTTLKSIDELPPGISSNDSSKANLLDKVQKKNVEAILTISIISRETESRYVRNGNPYDPMGYSYYGDFWGYYDHWYPSFYGQGYYEENKVYFIETNLYDSKTEKLVWSAQSKTYSPDDLQPFSKEFASIIVSKMRTDGVLGAAPAK